MSDVLTPLQAAAIVCMSLAHRDDDVGNTLLGVSAEHEIPECLAARVEWHHGGVALLPANALASYAVGERP